MTIMVQAPFTHVRRHLCNNMDPKRDRSMLDCSTFAGHTPSSSSGRWLCPDCRKHEVVERQRHTRLCSSMASSRFISIIAQRISRWDTCVSRQPSFTLVHHWDYRGAHSSERLHLWLHRHFHVPLHLPLFNQDMLALQTEICIWWGNALDAAVQMQSSSE
jgi:hypothetical protein